MKLALPALVQVVLQTPVTKNQQWQDLDRNIGKPGLETVQMQNLFAMRGGQDHAEGTKHTLRNFAGGDTRVVMWTIDDCVLKALFAETRL